MFAVLAAVAFLLALFHVKLGSVDLVTLGLLFLALHIALASVWAGYTLRPGSRA